MHMFGEVTGTMKTLLCSSITGHIQSDNTQQYIIHELCINYTTFLKITTTKKKTSAKHNLKKKIKSKWVQEVDRGCCWDRISLCRLVQELDSCRKVTVPEPGGLNSSAPPARW